MADEKNLNVGTPVKTPAKKEVGRWESEGGQPRPLDDERSRTDREIEQDPNAGVNQGRKGPVRFNPESEPRKRGTEPTRH